MAVDLKIVLGTVNYTDYLRVSARKVSDPSTEVVVEYIDVPVSNYTLVLPNLDPVNYYIDFRDAPDTSSLGTLVSQAFVNAVTGEWQYERRFYKIGELGSGITATAMVLTDPYLENKTVSGVFKEGFRFLIETTEYTHDADAGTITLENPFSFSPGEVFAVEIKYNGGVASPSATAAGLFSATIQVTDATYTVLSTDKTKRYMLDASGTTQVITLCALSALATGDYFLFEHKRDGAQAQTKIVTAGTDKIFYNGLNLGSNELSELWVAKGQSLYLRKEGSYWEVIFDYAGARVGERMAATYIDHPNWLPEDGRLLDGDEYPGLYYWVRNVLPSTHKITDDTVVSGAYAHPSEKKGQFVIHSTLKKFRLPNTQGLSEKGLLDFDSHGADTTRAYDYPGGYQEGKVKKFWTGTHTTLNILKVDGANTGTSFDSTIIEPNIRNGVEVDQNVFGAENSVNNIGVIYMRHI